MEPSTIDEKRRERRNALSREEKYTDAELATLGIDRAMIPRHVAIIMDGNGRWAQKHGWPRIEGHRRGVTSVRSVVEEASRLGLQQLTLYCFSSENWKRPPKELSLLMLLLRQYLVEERREIQRQGLQFRVIGNTAELDPVIQTEMRKTIDASQDNDGMTLCLAINYGARMEITGAVQQIARAVQNGTLSPDGPHGRRTSDDERDAGPGSTHPHRQRIPHQQLSAVADQLFRNLGLRKILARISRRRPPRRNTRIRASRSKVWRIEDRSCE